MVKGLEYISKQAEEVNVIDSTLFDLHNIKQGLRNKDKTGVLIGLTKIGNVVGYEYIDGVKKAIDGKLFYRNIEIYDIFDSIKGQGKAFERVAYLLMLGKLPSEEELNNFLDLIYENSKEYINFDFYPNNAMNKLQHDLAYLYSFDDDADLITQPKILAQSLKVLGYFPDMILKSYLKDDFDVEKSNKLKKQRLGTARYFLGMLNDREYTEDEISMFDEILTLHAEHGGGNNSTFAVRLVTSAYTDTYSAMTAGVSSLKGLRHGGANISVSKMIEDIKANCEYEDETKLREYLNKILNKEVFDQQGLIYGIGHAIYTISDPRARHLKESAKTFAQLLNNEREYKLYTDIERIAVELMKERKGMEYEICANVDLYSGFVNSALGIDQSLFTPIFALSRIPAWSAHRSEQIFTDKKILRPAYKTI